jgi:hypothetical protein
MGGSRALPEFLPGCVEDIKELPTMKLRYVVIEFLIEIESGARHGLPLDERKSTGDLSDCFKIYFDEERNMRPNYRLVYRELSAGGSNSSRIQAVAVGRRAGLDVYYLAARRLNR